MKVPLLDLKRQYSVIKDEIKVAINDTLESQCFILGPVVAEFERQMAEYTGSKGAVGVSSGTDALLLALMALGVGAGDEVITSAFTFGATVGTIQRLGGVPVFADIDPDTYNINPDDIEKRVTSKTKAIMPVHIYGQCADMDKISAIAEKHGLKIIEDSAQAAGSKYKGKKAGSLGDLSGYSFFPSKNLGAYGDAGMVTCNSEDYVEKLKVLRQHGAKEKYYHREIGINGRLDALQAAVLTVKLKYLDEWCDARRERAAYYTKKFEGASIKTPVIDKNNTHIFHQYVIRVKDRDGLFKRLGEKGVGSAMYYPQPMHLQESLKEFGFKEGDLPETESAANETLALPMFPELTESEQDYVVETVNDFYSGK